VKPCCCVYTLRWWWEWLRQRHRGQSAELWPWAAEGVSSASHHEGQWTSCCQRNQHADDRDWWRQRQCAQCRTQRYLRIQLPWWVPVFSIYTCSCSGFGKVLVKWAMLVPSGIQLWMNKDESWPLIGSIALSFKTVGGSNWRGTI